MSLWSFVRAFVGTDIEVVAVHGDTLRSEERHEVTPPSTLTALVLLEARDGALAGHEGKTEVFQAVAARWLPSDVYCELFEARDASGALRYGFSNAVMTVMNLVVANIEPKHVPKRKGDDSEAIETTSKTMTESLQDMDWEAVISDYREMYQGSRPLEELFPYFLSQYWETRRLSVRRQVDWMQAYATVRNPEAKKTRDRMFNIAYPARAATVHHVPAMSDEEFEDAIAKAKAIAAERKMKQENGSTEGS